MEKITINDIIFATATIQGRITANIKLSGLSSLADIISAIKRELGSFSGLLTITLRNISQGWTRQRSLYVAPIAAGTQLSLF